MMKLLSILTIAVLAACGSKAPATTTPTPTATMAPAGTVLTITELTFFDGDKHGLTLHADGKLEIATMHSEAGKPAQEEWKTVATVTADGKVSADGKVGQLNADGTFTTHDGQVAPFKIEGDTLVAGDKKVTIDDKGVFGGLQPGANVHVTGITDAGSKRTALLLIALLTMSEQRATPAATK